MGYSTGMMNKRVTVARRCEKDEKTFGRTGQPKYELLGTFWMGETFTKGVKAMHDGALDAYDTVMFRCRYNKDFDKWCLLQYQGKWYQITSFNADYQDNQIQMTAVERPNQEVNLVEPTPDPEPTPTPTPTPESGNPEVNPEPENNGEV